MLVVDALLLLVLNVVVDGFAITPDEDHRPQDDMLTRDDLASKLVALIADGASVVGTSRSGPQGWGPLAAWRMPYVQSRPRTWS